MLEGEKLLTDETKTKKDPNIMLAHEEIQTLGKELCDLQGFASMYGEDEIITDRLIHLVASRVCAVDLASVWKHPHGGSYATMLDELTMTVTACSLFIKMHETHLLYKGERFYHDDLLVAARASSRQASKVCGEWLWSYQSKEFRTEHNLTECQNPLTNLENKTK
tara:strand:+ start:21002 stop:21496 length:495 start_codon:yes stop_codon:yes gene_type:complete